jgi:hypothetical protein
MMKTAMTTFRLTPAMQADLKAIERRDGVPVAEQIRRGIQLWLDRAQPATPPPGGLENVTP